MNFTTPPTTLDDAHVELATLSKTYPIAARKRIYFLASWVSEYCNNIDETTDKQSVSQ